MLSLISTMMLMTNAFVIKRHEEIVTKCDFPLVTMDDEIYDDFIVDDEIYDDFIVYDEIYDDFIAYDTMDYNKGNIAKLTANANAKSNNCSKVELQTDPKVNLTEYIRSTWYVQQQQVNGYQPISDLYCVAATYSINTSIKVPLFNGKVISVYNYANRDKVNGLALGNNSTFLCARETNASHPEKLSVAPCFLPNLFAGPYWILAAGPTPSNYTWAVVIGGQPTVNVNSTCTTRETGINNSGLWIFTRERIAEHGNINYIRSIIEKKNISTSKLINVTHENCSYSGAFIKN